MGLARTPPPGGSERSPSSAPHPSSPSRVRGSAQKTDWTGLPSSAQTALRPPSSVLQPRSTNDLDESDLFARIAPSSSPLKAHVPPPSRPSLDRLAPDSQSLIQSQFRDAPDSQAPEASQNARFGDAAEQRDNSPQHGGNYAADVFGRRPKLARSPPRPVQEEQEDEQQAVEAAQEPQKGGEVSDLMEVDMQGDEALDEALDGVPALTSAEPAVTVPEAPKAERDGGYKGLAKALFGRQGTLPPGKARHSLPVALSGSNPAHASPSGTTSSLQTDSAGPLDMSRTYSQPSGSGLPSTSGMARSASLGTLSQIAQGAGPPLTIQDAVSTVARVRVQLNDVKQAHATEQRSRQEAETLAEDLAAQVAELEQALAAARQDAITDSTAGQADQSRDLVDEPGKETIKVSPDEYESLVGSLSSIPGLQSTIARLRFRDARRHVEAAHQRWQRKWLLQWGEVDDGAAQGRVFSDAVRRERVELAKANWREQDLKGRVAEIEYQLHEEQAKRAEGDARERVMRDQQEALTEELEHEREIWRARQTKSDATLEAARSGERQAQQDRAAAEDALARLRGETEGSKKQGQADDRDAARKLKVAEDARKKAVAEAARLRAELETSQETIEELQAALHRASKKVKGAYDGVQEKVKESKTKKAVLSHPDQTVVEDSQPARHAAHHLEDQKTGGRAAAKAAREALVESDAEDDLGDAPNTRISLAHDGSAALGAESSDDEPVRKAPAPQATKRKAKFDKGAEEYSEKKTKARVDKEPTHKAKPGAESGTFPRPGKLLGEKTNGGSAAETASSLATSKGKRKAAAGEESDEDRVAKKDGDHKKKRRIFGAKEKTTFTWSNNDDNALGLPPELSPIKKGLASLSAGVGSQSLGRSLLGLSRSGSIFGR